MTPLDVIDNPLLVVPRPWKQRLFSRPWRPWVRHQPDPQYYVIGGGKIAAHPHTADRIRAKIRANNFTMQRSNTL